MSNGNSTVCCTATLQMNFEGTVDVQQGIQMVSCRERSWHDHNNRKTKHQLWLQLDSGSTLNSAV